MCLSTNTRPYAQNFKSNRVVPSCATKLFLDKIDFAKIP